MKKIIIIASSVVLAVALIVTSVFLFNRRPGPNASPAPTGAYSLSGKTEIIMQLGSPRTLVNNILKLIDPADARVIPAVADGATLVPLRFLGEALGAKVTWTESDGSATIAYAGKTIIVKPGSRDLTIDGKILALEAPVTTAGSRLLVPLKGFSDAAGLNYAIRNGQILVSESKLDITKTATVALLDNALARIANLKTASDASGLLKMFKDNIALATSNGAYRYGLTMKSGAPQNEMAALNPAAVRDATADAATGSGSAGTDYSQTNVQVQGVDEADTVKTDGDYIYKISGYEIVIIDASPAAEMKVVARIPYANNEFQPVELYVDGKYLTVIGNYSTNIVPINQPVLTDNIKSNIEIAPAATGSAGSGSSSGSSGEDVPPVAPSLPADRTAPDVMTTSVPPDGQSIMPELPSVPLPEGKMADMKAYYSYSYSYSRIYVYDITDKTAPEMMRYCDVDGYYVTSRKIGSSVYLVANKNSYYSADQLTVDSIVPIYRDSATTGDELKPMPIDSIYFFNETFSPGYLLIAGLNLDKPEQEIDVSSYLGSGMTVYASADNLYVSYADYQYGNIVAMGGPEAAVAVDSASAGSAVAPDAAVKSAETGTAAAGREPISTGAPVPDVTSSDSIATYQAPEVTTKIFKFSLLDGTAVFLSRGEVPGTILNQFSMDEFAEGNFRVATTDQGSFRGDGTNASTNNVYVLDYALNRIGAIEDLAPGEQIYSARFLGTRGYLVTYRTVDPLFVLDFTVPSEPKVLGQLKIPGFSDYLHPIDANHIIGFGKDTTEVSSGDATIALYQGLKIAIFDVTDPTNPIEEFKTSIGDRGTNSELLNNHKALLFSLSKNLLVLPVSLYEIRNRDGMTEKQLQSQYGVFTYQGAYVYAIDPGTFQLTLRGRITHLSADDLLRSGNYEGDYSKYITRSLYIGDTLYTVSDTFIQANALNDLSVTASLNYK